MLHLLNTKEDIIRLIQSDESMMEMIITASTLNLPDWWICAGLIRTKIWDTLHGYSERTNSPDVDVIYFDKENINELYEKDLENKLKSILPTIPWSVKNQARMHTINQLPPYTSSEDAISKFPETATSLGVKLDKNNKLILTAPHGIEDVVQLIIKPTPTFIETERLATIYEERLVKKNWKDTWYKLNVQHINKN